jgi:regulatory protein
MLISDIQPQKRRKDRVSVFIDDEFWTGMTQSCMTQLGLQVGDSITDDQKQRYEDEIVDFDALGYCLRVLANYARTTHQLADSLRAREFNEHVVTRTIDRCKELLLVNDEEYAYARANARKESGYGSKRSMMSLKEVGIPDELAEKVVEDVYGEIDESQHAAKALGNKYKHGVPRSAYSKAMAFLIRRGFSSQAARHAISAALVTEEASEKTRHALSVEDARRLIERKFPSGLADPKSRSKAWAMLARRNCPSDMIRALLAVG